MKNLINRFQQMNRMKGIVIVFITSSFVSIIGLGIYHSVVNHNLELDNKIVNVEKDDSIVLENDLSSDIKSTEDQSKENVEEVKQKDNQQKDSTIQTQKNEKNINNQKKQTVTSNKNNSQQISQKDKEKLNKKEENNQTETTEKDRENHIVVNVKVIGIDKTMMSGQLDVEKDTTVYEALVKLAKKNGKAVNSSGSYVKGIGGLNEKDYGPSSGWMYKVNDVTPNRPATSYELEDGDTVVWFYVNYH